MSNILAVLLSLLWSRVSLHALDVQTDAMCPQCICKKTLWSRVSLKRQSRTAFTAGHSSLFSPIYLKRASEWSFLSALLLFQGVYPAVRWTERSQLPLLLSFLFTATMKKHNRYSPPGHQNRFSINKRSPNVSDVAGFAFINFSQTTRTWNQMKPAWALWVFSFISLFVMSAIKMKWLSPLGCRQ